MRLSRLIGIALAAIIAFASRSRAVEEDGVRPFSEVIARFNEIASQDRIGRAEPPLTVDEVRATIHAWDASYGGFWERLYRVHKDDETFHNACSEIAETGMVPANMSFRFRTVWRNQGGHDYVGWHVTLHQANVRADGVHYHRAFPIRFRLIDCFPDGAKLSEEATTCVLHNLRQIDAAKEQWATAHAKRWGSPAPVPADLAPYIKGGWDAMKCPLGGTSSINPIGVAPTCSISEHEL